jgi:signal transduction histidine kinase
MSLAGISALLTMTTLLLVRQRVEIRVRDEISQGLRNSVVTFKSLQQQRQNTLERSAALLAALPTLKAVMTSQHPATIQDASKEFWSLSGSQLFVLADTSGRVMALHESVPGFTESDAHQALRRSIESGNTRDWWFGNGRLFEVFLQKIYFGSRDDDTPMGIVAVGYEIDESVAADVGRVAASQVAFQFDRKLVVSTVREALLGNLEAQLNRVVKVDSRPEQVKIGDEQFMAASLAMSSSSAPVVLTVLKSYDEATAFLQDLNRWIIVIGLACVFAGSLLVFVVSTTFTRPLAELVSGVHALERGDYSFPLRSQGSDEVSILSKAFQEMRVHIQESQRKIVESERLATIGRMASMISHDLRHPLTAILAYAEFLSEGHLTDDERKDFYQEIRIAVNRMTDEINSLLGFSKQRTAIKVIHAGVLEIIERAIHTVKVLPEYQHIEIRFTHGNECDGWFDPSKLERAVLNLLFNACEAVSPESGRVDVRCSTTEQGLEIFVQDNGPGIPESIRENLFQPFVSCGKEQGIGLGLTVVQKIMQDHGGKVGVEQTGPSGTVFKLVFPCLVRPGNAPSLPDACIQG